MANLSSYLGAIPTYAPPAPRPATLRHNRHALSCAAINENGNGATLTLGPDSNAASTQTLALPIPPAVSAEVQALMDEASIDFESSGLKYLSNEARLKALDKKANKVEKTKNVKAGDSMWTEIGELGELIRSGETKWEDLALDDMDIRAKWAGLFHRRKRAPGTFMMRLKVPNGEVTSKQLRVLGEQLLPLGPAGCGDITTRANLQLRGFTLAQADHIIEAVQGCGLSNVMSGMDNVRNLTGSPIAGIDPHEFIDVRQINYELNNMITNFGNGNPALANLPRKLNIGISPSRDDFPHTHINDVGLKAVIHPETGEVGFNVELGGYFSIKRNTLSVDGNTWVRPDQVVAYCKALLEFFRDHGERTDRQKARLMWLVESMGADAFRKGVASYMGLEDLPPGVHVTYDDVWERRDVLGIHPQKQAGYYWVGACVPSGRIFADDFFAFADIADKYGDSIARVTVEENILFPNIPEANLEALQKEPIFQKYSISAKPLTRGLVSCTGAQFCGIALIETKNRAMSVAAKLEEELDIPQTVRMHWTGCPNSCGQAQVGDIGIMGAPAKLDGKAVEGVRIMTGGTIGEGAMLASDFEKGIPCQEDILLPKLREILISQFGAKEKAAVPAREAVAA